MKHRQMMWLNYRRNHVGEDTLSVPSPFDGDKTVPYWYDKIAGMANDLAKRGVTDILLPNPVRGSGGEWKNQDGYGPYWEYAIGRDDAPTRFGTAEQLRRAIAVFHANGIDCHIDHVMHQRSGGRNGVYRYDAAGGKGIGRFPKDPGCFRAAGRPIPPFVQGDQVPSPADDFPFGDEFAPVTGKPPGYVWNNLIDNGDWLFRTLDSDGARVDDMKGINIGFMKAFMNSKAMKDKFFFGEYASGNSNDLNWWVAQVDGRASAIDFDFHYNMAQRMCMDAGSGKFYMGSLAGRGMIGTNPMKAIPFVESMDSDTNGFATIIFNKEIGYALMLMGEGLPQVYIRDYLAEPECYGLAKPINNLMWCANKFAHGDTIPRYSSARVFAFERNGPPGCIVTLNNDVWNGYWYTITVQTSWPQGTRVHDYTGHNDTDYYVDYRGQITIGVPPGAEGRGYGVWAPVGYDNQPIEVQPARTTTQDFHGADDLDLDQGPLTANMKKVARLWVEKDTAITLSMMTEDGHAPDFQYGLEVRGPSFDEIKPNNGKYQTVAKGWHTVSATGVGFAPDLRMPYRLRANYMASKTL